LGIVRLKRTFLTVEFPYRLAIPIAEKEFAGVKKEAATFRTVGGMGRHTPGSSTKSPVMKQKGGT
jgi:hypothetical protein